MNVFVEEIDYDANNMCVIIAAVAFQSKFDSKGSYLKKLCFGVLEFIIKKISKFSYVSLFFESTQFTRRIEPLIDIE